MNKNCPVNTSTVLRSYKNCNTFSALNFWVQDFDIDLHIKPSMFTIQAKYSL